jgi:Tfp pilus assembly protein PilN
MRANLLPQERRHVALLGLIISIDAIRTFVGIAAIGTLAFGLSAAVQLWRAEQYRELAARAEVELDLHQPLRKHIAVLAQEVALLGRIERQSIVERRSGRTAALAIIGIGNRVPDGVWLESLMRRPDGYVLAGTARSLEATAELIRALATPAGGLNPRLVQVAQPVNGAALRFGLRIETEGPRP